MSSDYSHHADTLLSTHDVANPPRLDPVNLSPLRAGTRTRRATAIGVGLALTVGALLGAGTALPASADNSQDINVQTSAIDWQTLNTTTGILYNARPHRINPDITGWTDAAFNRFGHLALTEGDRSWEFSASTTDLDVHEGGTSTLTLTGNTGTELYGNFTVKLVLTFQGNYGRWSYSITGGNTANVTSTLFANLGSDQSTHTEQKGNTLLAWDGPELFSPVLGFAVDTNGSAPTFTPDAAFPSNINIATTGASTFTTTVLVQDYVAGFESSQQAALDFVRGTLPALKRHFGETTGVQDSLIPLTGTTVDADVAISQDVEASFDQRLIDFHYFAHPTYKPVIHVGTLPAGLQLTATDNLEPEFPALAARAAGDQPVAPMTFTLSGTATTPGVYTVPVTVYLIERDPQVPMDFQALRAVPAVNDEGQPGTNPLDTSVTITVRARAVDPTPTPSPTASAPASSTPTASAPAAPTGTASPSAGATVVAGGTLAHTGENAAGFVLPIGILIALGAVLFIGARRRRAVS